MPRATHATNAPKFSKAERKVLAIARRRANGQLMRVPWTKFHRAYEKYPCWHALTLWTQAIIEAQGGIPSGLVTELQRRCPSFLEHEKASQEPKLLGLRLLEWVHNQEFGYAKRQGWLDALTFYGARHPRSECAFAYWEHCNQEWNRKQPNVLPAFDQWWQRAQQVMLRDEASYGDVGKAVEKYLDWEALAVWLRPLFAFKVELPSHVTSELERRCPGIFGCPHSGRSERSQEKSKIWRRLIKWRKDHCLSVAKDAGWLDFLLERVQLYPLHVRLVVYAKLWAEDWVRNRPQPYPSFRQWRRTADRYVEASVTSVKQTILFEHGLGLRRTTRATLTR